MERQETTQKRASRPATKRATKQIIISENDLRQRAYEIYLQRGLSTGNEVGDWLQAEQELKAN